MSEYVPMSENVPLSEYVLMSEFVLLYEYLDRNRPPKAATECECTIKCQKSLETWIKRGAKKKKKITRKLTNFAKCECIKRERNIWDVCITLKKIYL